jgi:hypothetical protein
VRVAHSSLVFFFFFSNLFLASSFAHPTKLVSGFPFKPTHKITPALKKVTKYGSSQLSLIRFCPFKGGVSPKRSPFLFVCVPSEKYDDDPFGVVAP